MTQHYCEQCGALLNPGVRFCKSCGSATDAAAGSVMSQQPPVMPDMFQQPPATPNIYQQPPVVPNMYQQPPPPFSPVIPPPPPRKQAGWWTPFRVIAIVLIAVLGASAVLGFCIPDKSVPGNQDGWSIGNILGITPARDNTPEGNTLGKESTTNNTSDESISDDSTPKGSFTQGLRNILMDASNQSGRLQAMQMNFFFAPGGAVSDDSGKGHSITTVNISSDDPDVDAMELSLEQNLDPSSGDAFFKMNVRSGADGQPEAAVYFTGDRMLIKPSNAKKQMIQHVSAPDVTASLKTKAALPRYMYMISNADVPALTDESWARAVDECVGEITAMSDGSDIRASEENIEIMGQTRTVNTQTLDLTKENAAAATRSIASLLEKDDSLKSLFITTLAMTAAEDMDDEDAIVELLGITKQEFEEMDEPEQMKLIFSKYASGLTGMIRDLDELPPESLMTSITTSSGGEVMLLRLNTQGQQSDCSIELTFYTEGFGRHTDIAFRGFDGSSVKLSERNIPVGGDEYQGSFGYEAIGSDGVKQSSVAVTYEGVQMDSSIEMDMRVTTFNSMQMPIPMDDSENAGTNFTIDVTMHFSQHKAAEGSDAASSGTMSITAPDEETGKDETQTVSFEIEMTQKDAPVVASPPQFIPEAGVSSADHAGLLSALDAEALPTMFNILPFQTQMMLAIMPLYSS